MSCNSILLATLFPPKWLSKKKIKKYFFLFLCYIISHSIFKMKVKKKRRKAWRHKMIYSSVSIFFFYMINFLWRIPFIFLFFKRTRQLVAFLLFFCFNQTLEKISDLMIVFFSYYGKKTLKQIEKNAKKEINFNLMMPEKRK